MQFIALCLLFVFGFASAARLHAAPKPYAVTVYAGAYDRHQTPVFFKISPEGGTQFSLRDEQGKIVPVQIDPQGNGCFIQNSLRRGDSRRYQFVDHQELFSGGSKMVDIKPIVGSALEITVGGRTVLRYNADKTKPPRDDIKPIFARGGYLHPLVSPAGKVVTDDYATNHLHHHGVWFAWTKTEFDGRTPDFWNMGEGKGTVESFGTTSNWFGPLLAGFIARHRHVDLTSGQPVPVLDETWETTGYWIGRDQTTEYWVFDVVSTQQCATNLPLKLPKYEYGGLGFRGPEQWNDPARVSFLTSEGLTDREKADTAKGRWCDISGDVSGKIAGVAILGHPTNFRAPQPMRVHPKEPFFCFAPQQEGPMEITPDKPYVSRYRFIIHDGPPVKARLDQFWNDFANPPRTEVTYPPPL